MPGPLLSRYASDGRRSPTPDRASMPPACRSRCCYRWACGGTRDPGAADGVAVRALDRHPVAGVAQVDDGGEAVGGPGDVADPVALDHVARRGPARGVGGDPDAVADDRVCRPADDPDALAAVGLGVDLLADGGGEVDDADDAVADGAAVGVVQDDPGAAEVGDGQAADRAARAG